MLVLDKNNIHIYTHPLSIIQVFQHCWLPTFSFLPICWKFSPHEPNLTMHQHCCKLEYAGALHCFFSLSIPKTCFDLSENGHPGIYHPKMHSQGKELEDFFMSLLPICHLPWPTSSSTIIELNYQWFIMHGKFFKQASNSDARPFQRH